MISLNKIFYGLFVLMLICGLYTYQLKWFKPADEIVVLSFALLCVLDILGNKNLYRYKGLFGMIGVMTFYLFYSLFALHYNTPKAILSDYFIQLKPFIGFYVAYSMGIKFSLQQREFLKKLCIVLSGVMLLLIVLGLGLKVFFHPVYYGIISTLLFFIYYYCCYNNMTQRDKIIMLLILTVGLLSTRSKFYGFYVIALYVFLLYTPSINSRITLKQVLIGLVLLAGVIYVAWEKIDFYFISSGIFSGVTSIEDMDDSFARMALYIMVPEVLGDHLFLGSGLASYATYASGVVGYSEIMHIYGLDQVWGLLEGDCPFVSDTFFPELVQFGVIGIILFFAFWVWIYRKIKIQQINEASINLYKMGLLILAFMFIESVAGSVFLQAGGIMVMILLGFIVRELKVLKAKQNSTPMLNKEETKA